MSTIDFSHLSQQERLELIGELWDSLDPNAVPVTAAQKAEIDRRLATLDVDIANGRDAADVLAELRRRFG
jgi:putative addiction module component (TIGR02574 family)